MLIAPSTTSVAPETIAAASNAKKEHSFRHISKAQSPWLRAGAEKRTRSPFSGALAIATVLRTRDQNKMSHR
jgi:hypothetical protein